MEDTSLKSFSINKTNWFPVKFGDVVFEPKESVKDLANSDIKHVVGLEHIDPETIHLTRSAGSKESTTFTKKFSPGDVLFGRRRAYLKKAAKASFTGVCSGDITVFRAKEILLPELLPYIVQNDKFFDYAIKHSAGGLSPRVKFKDLANYEFLLPPKTEQEKLVGLLISNDELIVKKNEQLLKLITAQRSYQKKKLLKYHSSLKNKVIPGYITCELQEIADISGGSTPSRNNEDFWNGNIPWLTPTDVTKCDTIELYETKECITKAGLKDISNRIYPPDSVLYCSRATIGFAVINKVPMATNQGFSNFICKKNMSSYFLYFLLKHITPELIRLAGGSTFLEISKSSIRKFKVLIPTEANRLLIEKDLKKFEDTRCKIINCINSSKQLQKSIINKVF